MNKQMKLQLESVVTSIVEGDTAAAKSSFHEYLRAKTQEILLGEKEDCDDDMDDDKSDDKDDKSDKKEDKDDKKPAFLKKKKGDDKDDDKKDD